MHFRWNKKDILSVIDNHIIDYPTPINITSFWSFGFLSALCLCSQLITGIFLAMHYTPNVDFAFSSIEHLMRDVNNGWIIRYIHSNGASMFFIVVYIHIFRGIYFGSYMKPRSFLWCSGILILLFMMGTSFLGYVLPWGQMSFWGATVITNLVSAIPFIGNFMVEWIWGGFSVGNATLNRFFSIHYFLPFIIFSLVILHISLLHKDGSNNPLGVDSSVDKIPFYPYFYIKDLFTSLFFISFFSLFLFYLPNYLGHPDNYLQANSMVTPSHIVPEWYFLPFYAILRSIPDKLGGVISMFSSIFVLFLIPFLNTSFIRSSTFRPIYRKLFWFLLADFVILGWVGQKIVETPYIEVGQFATIFYFIFFCFVLPLIGYIEQKMLKYNK